MTAGKGHSNVDALVSRKQSCDWCDESFEPRIGGRAQRFCSVACRVAYHKERYLREVHRCPRCGRGHEP